MASKLRLNVVCPSRDKKFLVIAEDEWLLEDVKACIEIVFQKLYPDEPEITVSTLQNEFHFDLPLDYSAGDALVDAGLVFAIEDEVATATGTLSDNVDEAKVPESPHTNAARRTQPKKLKKKHKLSKKKILTKNVKRAKLVCTSSNKVTSTTGPVVVQQPSNQQDHNMLPQVVENNTSEDTEVDIETVDEDHDLDVIN